MQAKFLIYIWCWCPFFILKKKKKKNPWLEQFVFKMMFILQLNYVFSLFLILAFNS